MGGQKDVNMLMALIAMAKVGGILRVLSDSDGANSLGDGTTDASFDACDTNDLPDDDVIEVATGFGLLIENISSLLGSGSSTEATLNAVSAAVDLLCDPGSTYNFTCVIRDESEIEEAPPHRTNLLNSYRLLLDNKDLGIGSCDPATNPGGCC